ncbi:hypothetical protein BD769DRAFT_1399720, partial [Suillus cothurnatus]
MSSSTLQLLATSKLQAQHCYRVLLEASEDAIVCYNCELRQRQYFCANCLKNRLPDFRLQTHHSSLDKDEHIARASRAFRSIESGRLLRAKIARADHSLNQFADDHAKVRRDCESTCLGLVQELVEVFHVVESGGRPGARGEWTIGGPVFQYWEMLDFCGLAEDSMLVCLGSEQDEGVNLVQ